jgi:hypothetical protein
MTEYRATSATACGIRISIRPIAGTREGSDWLNYWDETNLSSTKSNTAALSTYNADVCPSPAAFASFNGGTLL